MNQTRHILAHKPVRKHCASGLSERGSHERVLQLLLWFPSVSRAWMKPPHSDLSNYMWIEANGKENQIKGIRLTKKLNLCINSYGPSVLKALCLILLSLGFYLQAPSPIILRQQDSFWNALIGGTKMGDAKALSNRVSIVGHHVSVSIFHIRP